MTNCYICNESIETYEDDLEHVCKESIETLSIQELRDVNRIAYMDGRHWNSRGGLNK